MSKEGIKDVLKKLEEEVIGIEDIFTNVFFEKYTNVSSLEEFEEKFNIKPGKGDTKEKFLTSTIRQNSTFKNMEEMKTRAIEFYLQNEKGQ